MMKRKKKRREKVEDGGKKKDVIYSTGGTKGRYDSHAMRRKLNAKLHTMQTPYAVEFDAGQRSLELLRSR